MADNNFDIQKEHHHQNPSLSNPLDRLLSVPERLAILETRFDQISTDFSIIREKLEELVELKHKGLGAFWLIGLIVGTGLIGLVSTITGFFNRGHL